ncbi:MAG: YaiI/YqxD family protein [bacterium]
MLHIYVDADACPVKQEVSRVALRYHLDVTLVANSWMRIPKARGLVLKVVGDGFDEADNWIVEQVQCDDIVITSDIPLAGRCLKKGACVIGSTGKSFKENSIGQAIATRALMAELRDAGEITGGPAPMQGCDRSRFLQELDGVIQTLRRKHPAPPVKVNPS